MGITELPLAELLNASDDIFFVCDKEQRLLFLNKEAAIFFGDRIESLIGKKIDELVGKKLSINFATYKNFFQTLEKENSIHIEYRVSLNPGTRYYDAQYKLISIKNKTYITGHFREVSAIRKKTKVLERTTKTIIQEIDRQKILFETVLNHNPDSLVFTDDERRIMLVNDTFCTQFGYRKDEVLGEETKLLYANTEDYSVKTERRFKKTAKEDFEPYMMEYKKKSGEVFISMTIGSPVKAKNGEVIGFLGVIRDITEELEMKEQLKQEQAKAVHSSRMAQLGEFSGFIAHEINSPLATITSTAQLLKRKLSRGEYENKKFTELVCRVQDTAIRIADIVKTFRNFSRQGNENRFEVVRVEKIIQDILIFVKDKFNINEVNFKVDWNNLEHHNLYCDPVQIGQVILNLLNNSLDAIVSKSEKWIKLEFFDTGKEIELHVVDSGKGIKKENQGNLMNAFFTTKERGKGTGLGLNISFDIAKNHNGVLYYDKNSNNTRFVLVLPKHKKENNEVA